MQLLLSLGTAQACAVNVQQLVIAGWTGRDRRALEQHIGELESLGVKRPSTTPIFYRVSASRVTVGDCIEVTGGESSGEVEFVLLESGGKLWIGVGSDHTDRAAEAYDVTVAKQMCEKPIAPSFWDYDEVARHWSALRLRSHIIETADRVLYQEGSVLEMLDPLELITQYTGERRLPEACMMFCGTLAARGGVRSARRFDFEIEDPVSGRRIAHGYRVKCLPVSR